MKILIYGAGKYCDMYLQNYKKDNDRILAIVDSDINKWGTDKQGYTVISPEQMSVLQYDKLIIAVEKFESILDSILLKKTDAGNIFVFRAQQNELVPLASVYDSYLENKIYRISAIRQIKIGLLMESFREEEYYGYDRIIVSGSEEDYCIIKEFFTTLAPEKEIIYGTVDVDQIVAKDKFIFCGTDYKRDLSKIRSEFLSERQWILLPLFDVKNTIKL